MHAADGHSSTPPVSRGGGVAAEPSRQATDPGALGGPPKGAPLFGLAPCGVYQAAPVTRGTGGLLPHRFTLTGRENTPPSRRFVFCGTFLPVTGTGCYPAQCPVEFGLSSPRNVPGSDHPFRSDPPQ